MPPKRSGSVKKKKGPPYNPVDDLKQMDDIHEVLEKAQQLRNYFQVERDKVHAMWEVSKKDLENERFHEQNEESELETMERDHQMEMKVYKQKVRHLLYDHRLAVKQLKEDSDRKLIESETQHEKRMAEITADRQKRSHQIQSSMEAHESKVVEQRDSHAYMVKTTKMQSHEKELARLKASYESKLATLREELDLRSRAEVNEAEEARNQHINNLIQQHEATFAEMKTYYKNVTQNNLDIIRSLKDEIEAMKTNDEHNEGLMYDIERENQNLVAPLEQAERDVAQLQLTKKQFLQDKQSLAMTRARLRTLHTDLERLRAAHQDLEENYRSVYGEREDLKAKFESSLREAMDVVNERNASLQQHLLEVNAKVDERDAQTVGVLRAMNLEPAVLAMVSDQIDSELDYKNQIVKDMYFELRKLEKRSESVLSEYERRCRAVNLPPLARENFVQA